MLRSIRLAFRRFMADFFGVNCPDCEYPLLRGGGMFAGNWWCLGCESWWRDEGLGLSDGEEKTGRAA